MTNIYRRSGVIELKKFVLAHDTARRGVGAFAMTAPAGWNVTFRPPTRSLDQNALLHAVLTDISKQVEWFGQKFTPEIWKRLCMAAWLREKNEKPMLIPALDGYGVDIIFERTSKLTTAQCSDLVEWCFAFGAEKGVIFKDRVAGAPA